jgi:hypothetical protein
MVRRQTALGQRIGLERDMQAALRIAINQLEAGLVITDDGAERSVDSGFIDITARSRSGGRPARPTTPESGRASTRSTIAPTSTRPA